MKFDCSFCNLKCKSNSGLARHIREKHNFRTWHQYSNNQETEPSIPLPSLKFPIHEDFEDFTLIHDNNSENQDRNYLLFVVRELVYSNVKVRPSIDQNLCMNNFIQMMILETLNSARMMNLVIQNSVKKMS